MDERIKRALAKKPSCLNQLSAAQLEQVEQKRMARVVRANNKVITNRTIPEVLFAPTPTKYSIFVTGSIVGISGYDNLVYEIVKGLYSLGVDVRINASCPVSQDVIPKYFQSIINLKNPLDNEIMIMPPPMLFRWRPNKNTIIFTMWESDRLESSWADELNKALAVVVPSQWAIDTFRASGVTAPMYKIPLGCDPLIFHSQPIFPKMCTFGTAAALTAGGVRKNVHKILRTFLEVFEGINDVRLRIKVTPVCPFPECKDPRVDIIRRFLPPAELAEWHGSLTSFVNGSFAEGFGLHLLEAMACGRPLISTEYSAVTEYFDDTVGYSVLHKLVRASGGQYSGLWAEPNSVSLGGKMLEVYKNQEKVKKLGEKSAIRAKTMLWKNTGQALYNLLLTYGMIQKI